MSHSITVRNPMFDDKAYSKLLAEMDMDSPQWDCMYEIYQQHGFIAQLSRSAGNSLNQVLYLALGVMDEAYAGESGTGISIEFNDEQLKDAVKIIESKSFAGMKRPRNGVDDLVDALFHAGAGVIEMVAQDANVEPELRFLQSCRLHLRKSGELTVKITFA